MSSDSVSRTVVSSSLRPRGLQPPRLLCPWDSPGKNTGVGCHALLQEIFPSQGLNPGLLHCRQILYCLSYMEAQANIMIEIYNYINLRIKNYNPYSIPIWGVLRELLLASKLFLDPFFFLTLCQAQVVWFSLWLIKVICKDKKDLFLKWNSISRC